VAAATPEPTPFPTPAPTEAQTASPTVAPTTKPTVSPTGNPTVSPSVAASAVPTSVATENTRSDTLPPDFNTEITKCQGDGPVTMHSACVTGDPHITTFDGVNWDCMGHGEHVLLKSTITRRQVQGRFIQVPNKKLSSMRAIVIQDEGNTPSVQISVPVIKEGMCIVW